MTKIFFEKKKRKINRHIPQKKFQMAKRILI